MTMRGKRHAAMIERNRHRDACTDFSASGEIPGLKKRISAYVDLRVKPWWIRPLFFWIATLLQMTWPYRWLFRAKTGKSYYALKKKMYKSTTPPREVDLMDPIAVLVGGASSAVNAITPAMTDVINPGIGNPAFQNGYAPYPPDNPATGPSYPAGPQGNALPATYEARAPYQPLNPLNAATPAYSPYPAGSAYSGNPAGPALPPYSAGPQPGAPLPSYELAAGCTPQATNENCPPGP